MLFPRVWGPRTGGLKSLNYIRDSGTAEPPLDADCTLWLLVGVSAFGAFGRYVLQLPTIKQTPWGIASIQAGSSVRSCK